jgi:hypothetical protein
MTDPWQPIRPGENMPWSEVEDRIPPEFQAPPSVAGYPAAGQPVAPPGGGSPYYGYLPGPDPRYSPSPYSPQPYPGQPYPPGPGYPQTGGYPMPGGYLMPGGYPPDPGAPFGRNALGEPWSDKDKVTAGLLQIFLGMFGVGRFYLNQPGIALAQIAVAWLTCGLGYLWPLIDGIMILSGGVRDERGRPLRD